ncbi:CPBP family glutamic-type intramembrane protease [Cetobacterium sp.]|uniref:CPBP family glutamic-type intramembrane protease n=1 Tax=Cetobacterium sp. TaxID=2071632 RepID=UPI003EE4CF85
MRINFINLKKLIVLKDIKSALQMIALLYFTVFFIQDFFYYDNFIFNFLEQPLFILLPTFVIIKIYFIKNKTDIKIFYKFRKISFKTYILLTVLAFLLLPIINIVSDYTNMVISTEFYDDLLLKPETKDSFLWHVIVFFYSLFFTSIFPGVCEEILFRGAILTFSEKLTKKKMPLIIFNALLFAIFHQNIQQLFYTFILGLIFTAVVIFTNSIFSGIYIHIFFNFIVDLSATFDLDRYSSIAAIDRFIEKINTIEYAIISSVLIIYILIYLKSHQNYNV